MTDKAIIFDLDGTLLDTLDDIAWSMNAALAELGAPEHSTESYRGYVGRGLDMLAHDVLPGPMRDRATVERSVAIMRRFYAERWSHATKPYAGIPEMLAALRKRNTRCAVYSNKAHDFTVKIANYYFGAAMFEIILGGGKYPPKPDPAGAMHIAAEMKLSPPDFLYVGDSDIDMQTARNAGMYSVGVTWGFRTREELVENGAKTLIDRPADLIRLLDENLSR